jgi:hypothetical protein
MAATPDNDEREPAQDETAFERFRDLAGKLIRVPRHEVDAERAKEDERKEKEGH